MRTIQFHYSRLAIFGWDSRHDFVGRRIKCDLMNEKLSEFRAFLRRTTQIIQFPLPPPRLKPSLILAINADAGRKCEINS